MTVLRIVAALLAFNLLFLILEMPQALALHPVHLLAWDAASLVGLALVVGRPGSRLRRTYASVAAALVILAVLLAGFEIATRLALSRPLNVYVDYPLIAPLVDLAQANLSRPLQVLAAVAVVGVLIGAWLLPHRGLAELPHAPRTGAGLAAAGLAGMVLSASGVGVPGTSAPGVALASQQVEQFRATRDSLTALDAELPADGAPREGVAIPRLSDVNVIIGFVESYGVTALFDAPYRQALAPTLDDMAERLDAAGLHVASGTLDAPMRGGQSWLSHATTLSGQRTPTQRHYRRLLASAQPTLADDFRETGHRSVFVSPAITRAWPEGEWYGFDRVLTAGDLGYAGPPFQWFTMPDQYTWKAFERDVLAASDAPVFGVLALVSSHAPWTPIVPIVDDWDTLGDGSGYHRWAGLGPTPPELWRDLDAVRTHFARSIDYVLRVSTGFAERNADDRTLLILLGDHQPSKVITGRDPAFGVPVHVISGDPALLAPFRAEGFAEGVWPDTDAGQAGFEALRPWLHAGFGD